MSTNNRVLVRYRTYARPRRLSPYRRVRGEWVTNSGPVYVRRVPGKSMALSLKARHGYTSLLNTAEQRFVERIARRRGWVLTSCRDDITTRRWHHLDGDLDCDRDLLDRLNRVGKRLGKVVFVRSGRRDLSEQQRLWNLYQAGRGPLAAYPNPNAPHVRGVAADCGIDGRDIGDYPGAIAALRAEGLGLPVAGEDWHVEITGNMRGAHS